MYTGAFLDSELLDIDVELDTDAVLGTDDSENDFDLDFVAAPPDCLDTGFVLDSDAVVDFHGADTGGLAADCAPDTADSGTVALDTDAALVAAEEIDPSDSIAALDIGLGRCAEEFSARAPDPAVEERRWCAAVASLSSGGRVERSPAAARRRWSVRGSAG